MGERHSFLSPKYVEHEVNGLVLRFYPGSLRLLGRLRTISKPLVGAISTFFQNSDLLTRKVMRDFQSPQGEASSETTLDPISPELLKNIDLRREGAIDQVFQAITSEENRAVIGEIIMDSLREEFPRKPKAEQIREFVDDPDLDVATTVQLLTGVAMANKGLFGPLAEPLAKRIQEAAGSRLRPLGEGSLDPASGSSESGGS